MALDRKLRYNRIEAHRLGSERLQGRIHKKLEGQPFAFYDNLNLYINTMLACNADCGFCIAKTDQKVVGRVRNDGVYLSSLGVALDYVKPLDPSVSIVGGEPSKDPRIVSIIRLVKEKRMRKPIMNTNSSGLDERLMEEVNKSSLQHINISRHHHDENENQRIMQIKPFVSNKHIEGILKNLNPVIRVRMQSSLIKGGISDFQDVVSYVEWVKNIGGNHVAFFELSGLPSGSVYAQSAIDYSGRQRVSSVPLLDEADRDSRFDLQAQVIGPFYYEEIFRYKDSVVVEFKTADFGVMQALDREDIIDSLVYHSNCALSGSWDYNKKIIIPPPSNLTNIDIAILNTEKKLNEQG